MRHGGAPSWAIGSISKRWRTFFQACNLNFNIACHVPGPSDLLQHHTCGGQSYVLTYHEKRGVEALERHSIPLHSLNRYEQRGRPGVELARQHKIDNGRTHILGVAMEGWIKLHRQMLANGWFSNPIRALFFIYLLLKASHKEPHSVCEC